MEVKNRFSKLLEQLIATAEVKHLTLAQALQFDVSYISKWVSGKVLPAERTVEDTLKKLCDCLVEAASEIGEEKLYIEYRVTSREDLIKAVFDNLLAEYRYVQEVQRQNGNNIAPIISYYPEISMKDFLLKMQHPVLRRVKSLNVMAAIDLLSMEGEYRMQAVSLNTDPIDSGTEYTYPDVHFSLLIDLNKAQEDIVKNTVFLSNMVAYLGNVDFKLYHGKFAQGKAMLVVLDEFSVTGMLVRRDMCTSVTVCEGANYARPLYDVIQSVCTREAMVFQKIQMKKLLVDGYIQSLLSPNREWMVTQITEHFLPSDLFIELLDHPAMQKAGYDKDTLMYIHKLTQVVLKEKVQILMTATTISDFVVAGRIDFFGEAITLNYEQRIKIIKYLYEIVQVPGDAEIRMIKDPLTEDFQKRMYPTVFLSVSRGYVRILPDLSKKVQTGGSVLRINAKEMMNTYKKFFEVIWEREAVLLHTREEIKNYLQHHMQNLQTLVGLAI